MADPIRVALVGCGAMAAQHLLALRRVRVAHRLVGLVDPRREIADRLAESSGAPSFACLEQLLGAARPDVVHICTPPEHHFAPACEALRAGAHVYVEKPFVPTVAEARRLFELAREHGRLACPGFQQIFDDAFTALVDARDELGRIVHVDSRFFFAPSRFDPALATDEMLSWQLLDVLPHPLYSLLAAFERCVPGTTRLEHARATPTELLAEFRRGTATGRLHVSLTARPVCSSITLAGSGGSRTADFMRGMVVGAGNPGTEALEKMLNPAIEGLQQQIRSLLGVARRLLVRRGYPGLAELLDAFYGAIVRGEPCPVPPDHVLDVVESYEGLARLAHEELRREPSAPAPRPAAAAGARTALVTGAGGWLGAHVCRRLDARGLRVRGLGRSDRAARLPVEGWVTADLAGGVPPDALSGVDVVVHAAAATRGGFAEHRRDSIEATRGLVDAMAESGVRRLVYVSSLAVLEPRRWREPPLDESAPLAHDPERLGPYIWGKCSAERVAVERCAERNIELRVVRPAALVDWASGKLPGRLGRRVLGRLHVCFGRPGLPLAACEIDTAATVVAWLADEFEEAPRVLNLLDAAIDSRGEALRALRRHGWRGRVLWIPICVPASAILLLRAARRLAGAGGPPLAAWKVLKPRRYDAALARRALREAARARTTPGAAAASGVAGRGDGGNDGR